MFNPFTLLAHKRQGTRAHCFFLGWKPDLFMKKLFQLAEPVLVLNNLPFDSTHCLQIESVAVGTHMDPSYILLDKWYSPGSRLLLDNTPNPFPNAFTTAMMLILHPYGSNISSLLLPISTLLSHSHGQPLAFLFPFWKSH